MHIDGPSVKVRSGGLRAAETSLQRGARQCRFRTNRPVTSARADQRQTLVTVSVEASLHPVFLHIATVCRHKLSAGL